MRKFAGVLWTLVFLLALAFFVRERILRDHFLPLTNIAEVKFENAVAEIQKQFIAPGALHATTTSRTAPARQLSADGVVRITNRERAQNDLPALGTNDKLTSAAKQKINDMFTRQYFAHVASTGEDAPFFVKAAGYEFLIVGENLAEGNFKSDAELVESWMGSEGHRKNILNPKYREIGVVVRRGAFEGRSTWLAVQVFGLPASVCPRLDETLRTTIEEENKNLEDAKTTLDTARVKLESEQGAPQYNRDADSYNALVADYNRRLKEVQSAITDYNDQVREANSCAINY